MGRKKIVELITYNDVIEIYDDRNKNNFSWQELYNKYGYQKDTIQKMFQYYKLPYKEKIYGSIGRTQHKIGLIKNNEIMSLRKQGYSYEYISNKLNVSIYNVTKICHNLNITKG